MISDKEKYVNLSTQKRMAVLLIPPFGLLKMETKMTFTFFQQEKPEKLKG